MRANPLALNHGVVDGLFAIVARALAVGPTVAPAQRERRDRAGVSAPALWRGLLNRLDQWSWRQRQRDIEAHLGKATDVYDLEARIRDLERGALYLHY